MSISIRFFVRKICWSLYIIKIYIIEVIIRALFMHLVQNMFLNHES